MHKSANTYEWKTCGNRETGGNWLVGFVITILLIILVFGAVVVYYQKNYQKTGRPPFRVPRFCPTRLFPRRDDVEAENLRVIQ